MKIKKDTLIELFLALVMIYVMIILGMTVYNEIFICGCN